MRLNAARAAFPTFGRAAAVVGSSLALENAGLPLLLAIGASLAAWLAIPLAVVGAWLQPERFSGYNRKVVRMRSSSPASSISAWRSVSSSCGALAPARDAIRTPLEELLARLPAARFWQVHRSIIVNQRAIASAFREDDGSMVVTLRGRSERLPVSRHFHGLFRGQ